MPDGNVAAMVMPIADFFLMCETHRAIGIAHAELVAAHKEAPIGYKLDGYTGYWLPPAYHENFRGALS